MKFKFGFILLLGILAYAECAGETVKIEDAYGLATQALNYHEDDGDVMTQIKVDGVKAQIKIDFDEEDNEVTDLGGNMDNLQFVSQINNKQVILAGDDDDDDDDADDEDEDQLQIKTQINNKKILVINKDYEDEDESNDQLQVATRINNKKVMIAGDVDENETDEDEENLLIEINNNYDNKIMITNDENNKNQTDDDPEKLQIQINNNKKTMVLENEDKVVWPTTDTENNGQIMAETRIKADVWPFIDTKNNRPIISGTKIEDEDKELVTSTGTWNYNKNNVDLLMKTNYKDIKDANETADYNAKVTFSTSDTETGYALFGDDGDDISEIIKKEQIVTDIDTYKNNFWIIINKLCKTLIALLEHPTANLTLNHIWREINTILANRISSRTIRLVSSQIRNTSIDPIAHLTASKIANSAHMILRMKRASKLNYLWSNISAFCNSPHGIEATLHLANGLSDIFNNGKYTNTISVMLESFGSGNSDELTKSSVNVSANMDISSNISKSDFSKSSDYLPRSLGLEHKIDSEFRPTAY